MMGQREPPRGGVEPQAGAECAEGKSAFRAREPNAADATDASASSSTLFSSTPRQGSVSMERPVGAAVRIPRATADPAGWRPPDRVGKYRVGPCIGSGGMGKVFLAHDTTIERAVAMKVILDPSGKDPAAIARLRREARVLGKFNNPHLLVIFDDGEIEGTPYLITELVKGSTLDKIAKPLAPVLVRQIGIGLASGLAAAHEEGILHRDVKPSNVILGLDGVPKLLDFGIAKIISGAEPLSTRDPPLIRAAPAAWPAAAIAHGDTLVSPGSGADHAAEAGADTADMPSLTGVSLMGTPPYMAPELWSGGPPSRRSDVYSLGALLFELSAGRPPHGFGPIPDLKRAIVERDASPLAELVPSIDPALAQVIARCLRRDPAERYASAKEVFEALQAVPEGNPYRGVQPYHAEHRTLFFGRTKDVEAILAKLAAERFVVVVGAPRVGKTSLCRCGVLPAARTGGVGGKPCAVLDLVPGRFPLRALAARLAALTGLDGGEILRRLEGDPDSVDHILAKRADPRARLLIFVDQLDDLGASADRREQEIVARILARLAGGEHNTRILATLRADCPSAIPRPLGAFIDDRTRYRLDPLGRDGLGEAILSPWRAAGGSFNSETLVETLIDRAEAIADGLPLLQFVLSEAWRTRDRTSRSITHETLRSIAPSLLDDPSGLARAFGQHAEAVIQGMTAEQPEARRILLALASGPEGPLVRRSRGEIVNGGAHAPRALDGLVRGGVIVVRSDAPDPVYELAHPALLSWCETLRRWLAEEARSRPARLELESAAERWLEDGKPRRELWSARQLDALKDVDSYDLTPAARQFRAASRDDVERRARNAAVLKPAKRGAVWLVCCALSFAAGDWKGPAVHAHIDRRVTPYVKAVKHLLGYAPARPRATSPNP